MRNGMYKDSVGVCRWFQNDQRHREDGPAVVWPDGLCAWYLNGKDYTEEEYNIELRLRKWGLKVDEL